MKTSKRKPAEEYVPIFRLTTVQGRTKTTKGITRKVPWIKIGGDWLTQAGFEPGQMPSISVSNKTLIISAEEFGIEN